MHILKSATIEGLWGSTQPITFVFDSKFNFIIGKNGCGKTTVINLIAAALFCDFDRLDKIPFTRVLLFLKAPSKRKTPSIEIRKSTDSPIPFFNIEYLIKNNQKEKATRFSMDDLQGISIARHLTLSNLRERSTKLISASAKEAIGELIKVSWLSVHRKNDDDQARDNPRTMPAVDQKLSSLANDLVKYFSSMSKKYEDQTKEFQKKSFLSLITSEGHDKVMDFVTKIDLDSEKKGLSDVFELLRLDPREYTSKIQRSYDKFSSARGKFIKNEPMSLEGFFSVFNAIRAHSLVQYHEDLQRERSEIFFPREEFVHELNTLFEGRKIVSMSPKNELVIKTKTGNIIKLEDLSSGEKQLIIILGEALLQESEAFVYIADEPELSLHVSWQEKLTSAIVRLNPNAQIVFATHSPDIVGIHQDKVLDMEKLTS